MQPLMFFKNTSFRILLYLMLEIFFFSFHPKVYIMIKHTGTHQYNYSMNTVIVEEHHCKSCLEQMEYVKVAMFDLF
jgi:hypothetical protein